MTSPHSTDAVFLLAQLASADPYTALYPGSKRSSYGVGLSVQTAASANSPAARDNQTVTSTPEQQSPKSALQMLQQLAAIPSVSSSDRASSRAVSSCASGNSLTPALQISQQLMASTSNAQQECRALNTGNTGPEAASDWHIIGEFCSRTVSRKWLRLVLHGWQKVVKAVIKWRCIQQVSNVLLTMASSSKCCKSSARLQA